MALKYKYATLEEIPNGFSELYSEVGGQYVLTGIEGAKSSDDVQKLNEALRKEREDHKKLKEVASRYSGVDVDALLRDSEELTLLKTKAAPAQETKVEDQSKVFEELVNKRLSPHLKEKETLSKQIADLQKEAENYRSTIRQTKIHDELRRTAADYKILPTAVDDILRYSDMFDVTEEGKVVEKTSLLPAKEWVADMRDKRPHWWAAPVGSGTSGSSGGGMTGPNPWLGSSWNITEQGKIMVEDPNKAARLAQAAGVSVDAIEPKT